MAFPWVRSVTDILYINTFRNSRVTQLVISLVVYRVTQGPHRTSHCGSYTEGKLYSQNVLTIGSTGVPTMVNPTVLKLLMCTVDQGRCQDHKVSTAKHGDGDLNGVVIYLVRWITKLQRLQHPCGSWHEKTLGNGHVEVMGQLLSIVRK